MMRAPFARSGGAALGVAVLAMTATACGGSDSGSPSADTQAGTAESRPGGRGAPGAMPGVLGVIAAVDGDVFQVQSQQSGQSAVTVTGDTVLTDQVVARLSDIAVGTCVVVRAAETAAQTSSPPEGEDARPTEVTAASVSITTPADDGCAGPGGAGGGPGGPGGPGERPSGMPTQWPTDRPEGGAGPDGGRGPGRGGFGAFGEVTAVETGSFSVDSFGRSLTVTISDSTTYMKQQTVTASALRVGRCARVLGDADTTGAVAAKEIHLSDAEQGTCGR